LRTRSRAFAVAAASLCILQASNAPAAEPARVIQISVDGLRGDLLAVMLAVSPQTDLPNFRRFVAEGTTTFNARTDYTETVTLPNHTSMLTGRPVRQPPGLPPGIAHGYTWNGTPAAGVTLHNRKGGSGRYITSIFDVVHDAGLSTSMYATKPKFVLYDRSYDAEHGAPDSTPPDFGPDKIDRFFIAGTEVGPSRSAAMQATLCADLRADPQRYVFVHYLDPDAAGHASGWGGLEWRAAVRDVDGYLGELFALVASDSSRFGRTILLLTADHGGIDDNHSNAGLAADYTIPFLCWGEGVTAGADLYALNPDTRADPGVGRPDYDTHPPPIRNGDAANLALFLLGLGPVAGSTINTRQDLRVHLATTDTQAMPAAARVH